MRTAGILGSLAIIAAAGFGWYSMAMTPSSGSGEKAPVGVSLEESMKKEMAVKTVNKKIYGICTWREAVSGDWRNIFPCGRRSGRGFRLCQRENGQDGLRTYRADRSRGNGSYFL